VNEDWLTTYRGWVYGAGFGFQLGLGWSTIITTSLVYSTFMVAALTASPALGAVIGLVFGVARAMPILSASRIQNPRQLASFHRTMEKWAPKARTTGIAAQAVVAVVIAGIAL
jgi:sulfite exporter TauE/SafE